MTNYRVSLTDLLRLGTLAATNPEARPDEVMAIMRAVEPITVVDDYVEAGDQMVERIGSGDEAAEQVLVHGLPIAKPE